MTDPTEDIRKQMLAEINAAPRLQGVPGSQARQVWDTRSCPMTSRSRLHGPARRRPQEERRPEGQPDVPGISPGSTSASSRIDRDTTDKGRQGRLPRSSRLRKV